MPWQPVKDLAHAICISNFTATEAHDLSLELGDHVYITEINGDWCRGWLLAPPSILGDTDRQAQQQRAYSGIFPRVAVHIRQVLGSGSDRPQSAVLQVLQQHREDDGPDAAPRPRAPFPPLQIGTSGREPLVGDITPCVNEWRATKLQTLAMKRDYTALEDLSALVDSLDRYGRDLSNADLTEYEMQKLRRKTTWDLVQGNKAFDGQVVVRNPNDKGRILTAADDLIEMLQLQAAMTLSDSRIPSQSTQASVYHILVTLHPPRIAADNGTLHMYLCSLDGDDLRVITETYDLDLTSSDDFGSLNPVHDAARTLFVNVPQAYVNATDPTTKLFLVCLLSTTEPARVHDDRPSSEHTDDSRTNLIPGGSISWRRRGSDTGNPTSERRPLTAASIRSKFTRPHTASGPRKASVDQPAVPDKRYKRTVGWTAIAMDSTMIKGDTDANHATTQFYAPSPSGAASLNEPVQKLLAILCSDKSARFAQLPYASAFDVTLQAFAHNDVDQLSSERPVQLRDVRHTPSFFPFGTKPRSDIYLSIKRPHLPPKAKVAHPHTTSVAAKSDTDQLNLQLTMEVRNEDGSRIEDAVAHCSNGIPHTAYRTRAIERGGAFNETIRMSLPFDVVPRAHLVMSIADGSNFPFALAWFPLWSAKSGFPVNGRHDLVLWDYSEHTVNHVGGKAAYQSLSAELHDLQHREPDMSFVEIETTLASTLATQDATVLEMLRIGKDTDAAPVLARFHTIPDHELAKFFVPLMQILDEILARLADSTQATISEDALLTFKCLTILYSLIRDFRYPHLRNLLDTHVQAQVLSPLSRVQSIKILRSLLSNPFAFGRDLRAALKVTDIVLRSTVRHQGDDTGIDDETSLRQELVEFFDDLTILLQNTNQLALPSQVVIIQHFPSWLAQVNPLLSGKQSLDIAVATIEACSASQSQSRLQRLSMIHQLGRLEIFSSGEIQAKFTALTATWLSAYWPHGPNVPEKDKAAIRLCCTIIKDQRRQLSPSTLQSYVRQLFNAYHFLAPSKQPRTARQIRPAMRAKFTPLFPATYPFQTYSVKADELPSEVALEVITLLGSLFGTGFAAEGPEPAALTTPLDEGLAKTALESVQSLQNGEVFPPSWLSMVVTFSRCQIGILGWLLTYMAHELPDSPTAEDLLEFSGDLWSLWFNTLSSLVTSQTVTMEYQSDQKRKAIWTIGGDIRQMAADLLQQAWQLLGWECDEEERELYGIDRVGGYQHEFTEDLVPSIVVMGLSLHTGLRNMAIETLRSMIIGLWQTSNDLGPIRSAFVDSFDSAFREKLFEPSQAVILLQNLETSFHGLGNTAAKDLHAAVTELISTTSDLVDLLSKVHVRDHESPGSQIEWRIELVTYLSNQGNRDSYLRHIHDIAAAHIEARNYVSAALILRAHVDFNSHTYESWHETLPANKHIDLPAQTVVQRQRSLLGRMVHLYRAGCCWNKALETLEDVLRMCDVQFDAEGRAQVHREQAEIYGMLKDGSGFKVPRHFRVTFGSAAVPEDMRDKTFIYEVEPSEDTESFARRLRRQYPSASVVHPGVTAPKEGERDAMVKINNVSIKRDYSHAVYQRSGVSPFFRAYHLNSDAQAFSTSTRQEIPDQPASEATVTKRVYHVKDQFPTVLGRSEVVRTEQMTLTPVQAAIDRTYRKTLDLAEATLAMNNDPSSSSLVDTVIRLIRSSIDPGSDSVTRYRKLLCKPTSAATLTAQEDPNPDGATAGDDADSETASNLDSEADLQFALGVALEEHARTLESALTASLRTRGEVARRLRDGFEEAFESELYAVYPDADWRFSSPLWNPIDADGDRRGEAGGLGLQNGADGAVDDGPIEDGFTDAEENFGGRRRPSWRRRRSSSIRTRLSFLGLGKGGSN